MTQPSVHLSLPQARALHLAAQGLLHAPEKTAQAQDLHATIERMGLLQIDTIHVVARSPYLVLFSRLGHYPMHWLEEALLSGQVFETWAHEACFAPAEDLLLHRAYNAGARLHWGLASARRSHAEQRPQLDQLLQHIRAQGPVKSSDFERPAGQSAAWWGWKDEKRWLEALFATGELMVARRENFHRVYDLSERVAPQLTLPPPKATLSAEDVQAQFIEKSIAALGISQARWVHDYFRMKPRLKETDLNPLVEAGVVHRVAVQGWDAPAYVHSTYAALLDQAAADLLAPSHSTVLSPFDPVVWDRERASVLFDFDYRLECYTPEAKRVYGYFVLPLLCRGALVGRLDAKAHRAQGVFEVKALYAQPDCVWDDATVADMAGAIARCAAWHATPTVRITRTQPAKLAAPLRRAIQQFQANPLYP